MEVPVLFAGVPGEAHFGLILNSSGLIVILFQFNFNIIWAFGVHLKCIVGSFGNHLADICNNRGSSYFLLDSLGSSGIILVSFEVTWVSFGVASVGIREASEKSLSHTDWAHSSRNLAAENMLSAARFGWY